MIEIGMHQVVKNYGYKAVLKGAGFEIMRGEHAALVGRNGSGKTTIFKILMQEEQADSGMISIRKGAVIGFLEQISGKMDDSMTVEDVIRLGQENLSVIDRKLKELERSMASASDVISNDTSVSQLISNDTSVSQLISNDASVSQLISNDASMSQLMSNDAGASQLTEMDRILKVYTNLQNDFIALDGYAMDENFNRIVEGFQIRELLDRKYSVLSGGQKTIVRMASTLLKQPDILLLDEPTNHLDISTLEWFEKYIMQYKGTVVFISHDRYFLDKTADKTIVLENRTCSVFHGNYSYSMKERERLLLIEFEDFKNQQKMIEAMRAAIKRYREWAAKGDNESLYKKAKELEKRLEKLEIIERPQLEKKKAVLNFTGGRSGRDLVKLDGFSLKLGSTQLFENADLLVRYKERVCLTGGNGTGKTSLIKVILGEYHDYGGTVKINPSALIGYIPQEIRFHNDKASVLDIFRESCTCTEGAARKILSGYFFCGSSVFKKAEMLSGGEKVLLKLAVLVQNQVNFLILDEPTNHIDIEMRELLEEALMDFEGTLFFISHDRYFVNKISDRVIEIKDKRLIES